MTSEELDELCNVCGLDLVRVSADDNTNAYGQPVVVCPGCLEVKRVEEEP